MLMIMTVGMMADGVFDGYWRLARLGRLSLAGYEIDTCAKASRSVQVTRHEEMVIPKPMIRHHDSVPYLVAAMSCAWLGRCWMVRNFVGRE